MACNTFAIASNQVIFWWAQQDSNLRLPPCEGGTLPLSYAPLKVVAMVRPYAKRDGGSLKLLVRVIAQSYHWPLA